MKNLTSDLPVFEEKGDDEYAQEVILDVLGPRDKILDRDGREYEHLGSFLSNTDFYQGLNLMAVIKRKSDGKEFGYPYWEDISKHGESFIDANGDEFGLECDTDVDGFDWDRDYVSYFVFEPVGKIEITGYGFVHTEA